MFELFMLFMIYLGVVIALGLPTVAIIALVVFLIIKNSGDDHGK